MSDAFRAAVAAALAPAYVLERELVGGGMSRVFVATEQALGRTVVVKVLSPELSAGVNRDRFRREIQLAAQLQHPHVVPLLSAGEHGDLLYYTMPYIEGESLRARLAERGRLPVREVVRALHDVVDALAYAHRRGVVHRDIKPANILVHGSHALVTDFGVAKALSAAMPHSGTTSVGVAMGTPTYMAPEQLAADPAADHRVDLYAVGLVAYELLTGASPFTGPSPRETMAAQLTRMPEPLHESRPDVPPALSAVVMRCLEKSPEARFATADELLQALEAAVAATPPATLPAAAVGGSAWTGGAATSGPVSAPTPGGGAHAGATSGATAGPASGRAAARGSARRWLVGGGLVAAGLLAGVALAARWQAGRAAGDPAATVQVLTAAGDSGRSISVGPVADPGAAPAAAAPRPLTRADSLAIAAAVRDRVEAAQPAAPAAGRAAGTAGVDVDSMTRALQRLLADSIAHAIRQAERVRTIVVPGDGRFPLSREEAAELEALARRGGSWSIAPRTGGRGGPVVDAAGRRRVVVVDVRNATGRRDLDETAAALGGALRGALEAGRVYDVLRPAGRIAASGRQPVALAQQVGAGAVLGPLLIPDGDSLTLQVIVTDARLGRPVATVRARVPAGGDPGRAIDALAIELRGVLGGLSWGPTPAVPPGGAAGGVRVAPPAVRIEPPPPPPPPPGAGR